MDVLGVRMAVHSRRAMAIAGLMAQRGFLESLAQTGNWTEWLETQPGFKEANDHYSEQGVK